MGTREQIARDIRTSGPRPRARLLAPLRYLKITAPEKRFYDRILPALVGGVLWVGFNLLNPRPSLMEAPGGLVPTIQGFLTIAVPFLIGALASVAMGLPGSHLDRRAPGVPILLDGEVLTLRQFVCYLLGYLSFLGVTLLVTTMAVQLVQPTIQRMLTEGTVAYQAIYQVGVGALMMSGSLFVITIFWALYFLTDIVNRHASN